MILTFRHKGLKQFFTKGSTKGIPAHHSARILHVLDAIDAAESPRNLMIPGFGIHQLKGDRVGTWAITVSGNMRITLRFLGIHATEVDLEDYH